MEVFILTGQELIWGADITESLTVKCDDISKHKTCKENMYIGAYSVSMGFLTYLKIEVDPKYL